MNNTPASLLHLMHLVSPALPVGAYAYSQGFEYAVERQWVNDSETTRNWIDGVMRHSLGRLDLPVLSRFYDAWMQNDTASVVHWNAFLQAARETAELELEDQQMGLALLRLLQALEIPSAVDWPTQEKPGFASLFALAGCHWQIDKPSLLYGFAWSWLENQIAAATKLVPLGQTQAQKLLLQLMPVVEEVVTASSHINEADFGAGLPGLVMASMQHETQYSRLFRS